MGLKQVIKYPLWVAFWNISQQKAIMLMIFILIGVAINVMVLTPTLNQSLLVIRYPESVPSFAQPLLIILGYFGLGIAYSAFTSLLFRPKRVVSPLAIQAATTFVLLIFIANYAINPDYVQLRLNSTSLLSPEQEAQNRATAQGVYAIGMVITITLPLTGWVQRYIVRMLVGINGTETDLYKRSFTINSAFEKLSRLLGEDSFIETYELNVKKKKNYVMLRSDDTRAIHIIIAMADAESPSTQSVLAIVSYEKVSGNLIASKYAKEQSDSVTDTLQGKLGRLNPPVKFSEPLIYQTEALRKALEIALEDTKAKVLEIKESKRYAAGGVLLGVAIAIMTYLHYSNVVPFEVYISSLVLIAITLILELSQLTKPKRHAEDD